MPCGSGDADGDARRRSVWVSLFLSSRIKRSTRPWWSRQHRPNRDQGPRGLVSAAKSGGGTCRQSKVNRPGMAVTGLPLRYHAP